MKNGLNNIVCLICVVTGLAIVTPVIHHKAQRNEEQTLAKQSEALANIRYHMIKTLQPSEENKRWLRVKKSQYLSLRNYRGYEIDMDEYLGASTTTIREALEAHVNLNYLAIRRLDRATHLYHGGDIGFKLRTFESLHKNANLENKFISPELQLAVANVVGSAEAVMKGEMFNGIDPSYFLYKKGNDLTNEDREFRDHYFNMYREYWIDYFLNDDAHIYRLRKEKLKYKYIF